MLTPAKTSSKAIVVNVEFVPIGVDDVTADDMESLWQWVDEGAPEVASRQAMSANGIRCGRLVREDRFRARLGSLKSTSGVVDEFLEQAEVAADISHGVNRIPMRLGRRYELPLRLPREGSHVTLVRLGDETIGQTLENPQFLFAVTPSAGRLPGEVHLRLRPEIQHGGMRQRWVSSDSALRIDTRRDTWSLEDLDLNVTTAAGQTLVIAAESPLRGLGKQMFSGHSANQIHQQLIVLINVAKVPSASDTP